MHESRMQAIKRGNDLLAQVAGRTMTFESPSAFSIFLKRLVNPARKADDGWKTVKYNGRFLEQFKLELARRRLGMRSEEGNSGGLLHSRAAGWQSETEGGW